MHQPWWESTRISTLRSHLYDIPSPLKTSTYSPTKQSSSLILPFKPAITIPSTHPSSPGKALRHTIRRHTQNMRLGDIEFYRHEVNNAPRVKYPPNIAAYSPALFRFVAPGDTISACPAIPNCNQSPIIGRVLEVASDSQQLNQLRNNCPIPIHPEVTEQQDKEISPFADQSYLLIQLYITSNQLSVLDESVAFAKYIIWWRCFACMPWA